MFELMLVGKLKEPGYVLPNNLGPGPQVLIGGDASAGYFGEVMAAEFITPEAVMNMNKPTVGKAINVSTQWLKFVYRGKILLVCKYAAWQDVKRTDLRAVNIYPGVEITVGENRFIHRCMRIDIVDPTSITDAVIHTPGSNKNLDQSEWGSLMFPVLSQAAGGLGRWANFSKAGMGWFAVDSPGNVCLTYESPKNGIGFCYIGGFNGAGWKNVATGNSASWMGHRPVLELIQ